MQNCNFTDCQSEPVAFIPDSLLRAEDGHLNVEEKSDDGKITSRTRYIYCRTAERFLSSAPNRKYTCEDGQPWTPYPLPTCLIG